MNSTVKSELGFLGASAATIAVTALLVSWMTTTLTASQYEAVALSAGILALILTERF